MKYAWVEDTETVQVELLDEEGNSFDPPEYEDVELGTGNGVVTGLNRGASEGERGGNITPQHLVWGMDNEMYKVVNGEFVALNVSEVEVIEQDRESERLAEAQMLAELEARVADLEAEQDALGVSKYTPDQIRNYIDNQIDSAATAGEKLEAIKGILKKLAIYILK